EPDVLGIRGVRSLLGSIAWLPFRCDTLEWRAGTQSGESRPRCGPGERSIAGVTTPGLSSQAKQRRAREVEIMLSRGLRRWLILSAVILVLVAAYAAFGFLGVPHLVRSNLESFVSTHYSRHIAVGDIRFNPFTLTLEIRAVSLPDTDGQ